jgi:DNA replication protein DnaD
LFTSFKQELKDLDGDALKVWIYLVLSINRYTKDARPGLRRISDDTGMAINTVRSKLDILETHGLLGIEKGQGVQSKYRPADYASVSKFDTPTVSKKSEGVSKNDATVSTTRRESAQLEELEELEDERFGEITAKLETSGFILNTQAPDIIDTWLNAHTNERIFQAVAIGANKKARTIKYIDEILIGWEANGYPKSRDQRIKERGKGPSTPQPVQLSAQELERLRAQAERDMT